MPLACTSSTQSIPNGAHFGLVTFGSSRSLRCSSKLSMDVFWLAPSFCLMTVILQIGPQICCSLKGPFISFAQLGWT